MIARLNEVDPSITHKVDDSVLFGETTRPRTAGQVLERFRFTDTRKMVAQNGLHQVKGAKSDLSVCIYPEIEILKNLIRAIERREPAAISRSE